MYLKILTLYIYKKKLIIGPPQSSQTRTVWSLEQEASNKPSGETLICLTHSRWPDSVLTQYPCCNKELEKLWKSTPSFRSVSNDSYIICIINVICERILKLQNFLNEYSRKETIERPGRMRFGHTGTFFLAIRTRSMSDSLPWVSLIRWKKKQVNYGIVNECPLCRPGNGARQLPSYSLPL